MNNSLTTVSPGVDRIINLDILVAISRFLFMDDVWLLCELGPMARRLVEENVSYIRSIAIRPCTRCSHLGWLQGHYLCYSRYCAMCGLPECREKGRMLVVHKCREYHRRYYLDNLREIPRNSQ